MPDPLLKFRRVHYADSSDGAKKRCYGPFTKPSSDDNEDGHSDAAEDLYLGGGGGGQILCQITQLFSGVNDPRDYIGVTRKIPVSEGNPNGFDGAEFLVAKSLPARMSATGTGSFTFVDDNHRTSDDGTGTTATNPEAQEMFPPFAVGELIFISAVNYSFVVPPGGEDLKWTEASTAREWTAPTKKLYTDSTPVP